MRLGCSPPAGRRQFHLDLEALRAGGEKVIGSPTERDGPHPTSLRACWRLPPRLDYRRDKTLVVEKIPDDHLSLGAVSDWFKKFGTVTNVAVDPPTAKALVTFAEHDQAWKAWKSEEAVFGNRFVKVYWHRPLVGRGGRGM